MTAIGETEWKEHAALVGAVTLAWNHNVHQVLRIFCHLTGLEDPLAGAIFFSHVSDRAQRLLVLKVAQAVDLGAPDLSKLKKLMERLDKAAITSVQRWRFVPGKRNGIPEAMWYIVPINFVLE